MNRRRQRLRWQTVARGMLLWMLLVRCGGGGSDRAGQGEGGSTGDGGKELTAPCAALQGKLEWQDEAGSNSGAEIWLLDHTRGEVTSRAVNLDGTYALECGLFFENHVLSLHLVREQRLIADFDFSTSQVGIQGAFSYAGGVGYDLGTTMVPRSQRGDIAYVPQGIPARMGGGFRVQTETLVDMNAFGSAFSPLALSVASQLMVVSPVSILQSFYLGAQNPAAYRQDLSLFSRVHFGAGSQTAGFIRRVNLLAGSSWLRFAREAKADDSGPGAVYWSARNFELDAADQGDTFGGDAFPGFVPKVGEIAHFQVFKSAGLILSMPRFVREVVLFPPMVTAVGTGPGSAVTAIDYQAPSQRNGLTRPFCENGDLRVLLAPPRTGLPGASGTTYLAEGPSATIEVTLEYYVEGQGTGSPVVATASDFSGVYALPQSQTVGGTVTRAWDPANQRLTFTANQGLFGETTVTVPTGVLASTVSGQRVTLTRLRMLWKNTATATGGGTVLWLKKQCP